MKLVAIVGTNSDRSTNRKLLKFMAKHFSDSADIEILEIKDLPAFNEPEDKLAPAPVADFSQKLLARMVSLSQLQNMTIRFLRHLPLLLNGSPTLAVFLSINQP